MNKEDLMKYYKVKQEISQIKEKLQEIEETYTQVRAMKIDGMPKGNSVNDYFAQALIKIEELKDIYNQKIGRLLKMQIKIERKFELLEPEERILARKRYMDGLKWEEVCEELNISWKTAHRLNNKILEKIKVDIE